MSSRVFQGVYLFITFLFINIGYYLYQLVLGKYMSVEDFGMMSSLFALQFLLAIPATIIGGVIMRYIPLYQDDIQKKREFITYIYHRAFYLSILFILIGIIFSPLIASYFGFMSISIVIGVIMTTVFYILVIITRTILYAEKRIAVYSLNNITEILFRIILSIVLIRAGYGYGVVYSTYIIAMIGSFIAMIPYISPYILWKSTHEYSFDRADIMKQLLPMTLIAVTLTLYGNVELMIAKRYLSVESVAHLGSAFLIGKIILSGLGLFQGVAAPYFARTRENRSFLIGIYSLFMLSLMIAVGIYTYFPEFIIHILFSPLYLVMAPSLGKMAVIMGILATFSLIWNHMIIAGKRYVGYVSIIPIILIFTASLLSPPTSTEGYIDTLFIIYIISAVIVSVLIGVIELVIYRGRCVKKL